MPGVRDYFKILVNYYAYSVFKCYINKLSLLSRNLGISQLRKYIKGMPVQSLNRLFKAIVMLCQVLIISGNRKNLTAYFDFEQVLYLLVSFTYHRNLRISIKQHSADLASFIVLSREWKSSEIHPFQPAFERLIESCPMRGLRLYISSYNPSGYKPKIPSSTHSSFLTTSKIFYCIIEIPKTQKYGLIKLGAYSVIFIKSP